MTKRILYEPGTGEIIEKKSRFIGVTAKVTTEEEAQQFLNECRKKHYDARHNCYGYVLGERREIKRFSDDGEPQGTGGKPILEVLEREHLTDVILVVTRYFGGTLLGTGGLLRAYQQAAREAISQSKILDCSMATRYKVTIGYELQGKLQYYLSEKQITVEDTLFEQQVTYLLLLKEEEEKEVCGALEDLTSGRIQLLQGEEVCYGIVGQKIILF